MSTTPSRPAASGPAPQPAQAPPPAAAPGSAAASARAFSEQSGRASAAAGEEARASGAPGTAGKSPGMAEKAADTAQKMVSAAVTPVAAAGRVLPAKGGLPLYAGLGGLALVGIIEWPVAVAAGAGYGLARLLSHPQEQHHRPSGDGGAAQPAGA